MSKLPTHNSSLSPTKIVFRQPRTPTDSQQRNSHREDSPDKKFRIGDRVSIHGTSGIIAFIGSTQFAEGEWLGIVLDEATGKNDGSHGGIRYFETDANRGLFCRPDKVQPLSVNGSSQRNSLLYTPTRLSAIDETNHTLELTTKNLQIGDRVVIRGTKYGTLKYIGKIHLSEGIWCGIKLDGPLGKHDGKVDGKRYFTCPHRFGIFAPLHSVEKVITDSNDDRRLSRQSIMSTGSGDQFHDTTSQDSTLSEFSTSSNSLSYVLQRLPTKVRQPNFSTDITSKETLSSTQTTDLLEKIKEKDLFIEKLNKENDRDHLELSNSIEKMNQMKKHMTTLQQQYETKEKQNEQLIKEQAELKQRLENLQFQIEEYQYPEIDTDLLKISDGDHNQLLFQDEITNYEQTKEKLIQLESINKNLIHEKQILQEDLKQYNDMKKNEKEINKFINDLEKQIESLKIQVSDLQNKEQNKTTQLNEKDTYYKQQIIEYQSKIDQITKQDQNNRLQLATLEQEKHLNDKQVKDLFDELKQYKESIVPAVEKECQTLKSELQNRDSTVNMALSERETYYQQQIKEYQANIDRATQEAQKIRAELKQLQEENGLKEKNTKSLIDELKENYEKVQDELKELNEREYTAKMTLSQRESYYEGQIKEYENNLNQAMHETQNIQNELVKLEEEKKMHDNKSNNTINSLKQDYEKQYEILKSQLAELQHKDHTSNIILNERIGHYEIQIKEYQIKIDQHIREIETLQTELTDLQQEKAHEENQFNDMINKLQHDYDTLTFELQERDQTQNVIINEREALHQFQMKEFETKRDQSLLEIQNLQSELIKLREEKTTSENQFKQTINTLKKDHERQYKELQTEIDELNERERKAHKTVHQREAEFEQQIKDYQDKIEEAILGTDHIQNQLTELLEEKAKFDDTNKSLKQDIERLKIELQDGDHTHNMTLKERDAFYELRIKEYQIKKDQDIHEIEILRAELTNLQEEKVFHEKQLNDTIIKLKHDYETLKLELQDQDQTQNMATNESEDYYQSQIKEYQTQRDQSLLEIQDLQSELTKLREEKITIENEFNETVNTLKQDHERQCKEFQTEIDELNEREHTAHKILHQREAEFEQQIKDYPVKLEEALLETQHIQNQLAKLLEEKSKFDDANKSLKQDIERLETELQDRDRIQNMAINERDAHYQSQIKEYQNKIDESLLEMQKVQSEVTKLREEKTTIENQFNETINTLKHDDEELSNKLNERENMILNELESQYKQQIDEYQKNLELSLNEIQNIKSELANLQEEKESNDKILNNLIMSLQQDFEKQTEILKTQNIELQRYHDTKNNELNETEQQIKEYELKFDQLNKNIEELQQQNEGKIEQINQLKTELDQQHQEIKEITNIKQQYEQTQNDLNQRMENLTQINEKLKQEREDFINQNEQQFTNQDSDETTEKHVSDNLLTKQLNDLQLMYDDLLQKQANLEQKYAEDKQAQEQLMKERIAEYETKIILKQNEFMVEMENTKLDHEQELLRLKAELHQATSTKKKK